MKKASINMTRTEANKDGKKGFVIEGSVNGSYDNLMYILAYTCIDLARSSKLPTPIVLMDVVKHASMIEASGYGADKEPDRITGTHIDASVLGKALERLKQEGSAEDA